MIRMEELRRTGSRHDPDAGKTTKARYVLRGSWFEAHLAPYRPSDYDHAAIERALNAVSSVGSEGYSGARMWMMRRLGYVAKSIGYLEFNTVRRTVAAYAAHRGGAPRGSSTVLASVYALYSVRDRRTGGTLRVLLTNSVLPSDDAGVHPYRFDFKGSRRPTRNIRGCGDEEDTSNKKKKKKIVRKERDLCVHWDPRVTAVSSSSSPHPAPAFVCTNAIGLSARDHATLTDALKRDTAYLESQRLVDYSLLVVFEVRPDVRASGGVRGAGTLRPGGLRFPIRRGGAPACLPEATSVVVGLIDTFTYYGILKRIETVARTRGRPNDDTIRASSVAPGAYRTRMLRFLSGVFRPPPPPPPPAPAKTKAKSKTKVKTTGKKTRKKTKKRPPRRT